ncbi:hypothetical protein KR222_010249 [Zaprionus bogoriensis]|nr:hypothetical protein KR222_010249 [Zaprionus bogoriensis]
MIRVVFSISQRAKVPQALLSLRGMEYTARAQSTLRQAHSYSPTFSRPLVRYFASGDDSVKASQGGIIGNAAPTEIGGATNNDITAIGQVQPAAYNTDAAGGDTEPKKSKAGAITSQIHATPSLTECGKICTDESIERAKSESRVDGKPGSKTGEAKAKSTQTGSQYTANNLANDVVKQWQEVAANLPSKEQVEKYFFRVVAFLYDIITLTANWTIRFVNEKIIQNETVKLYWKRFHEKMEQAKKD